MNIHYFLSEIKTANKNLNFTRHFLHKRNIIFLPLTNTTICLSLYKHKRKCSYCISKLNVHYLEDNYFRKVLLKIRKYKFTKERGLLLKNIIPFAPIKSLTKIY